jgi:hypothetical protein
VTDAPRWLAVALLLFAVALAYLGMWRGWRRRGLRHDLPPLARVPADAPAPTLAAEARYFGTTVSGDWLDRVVARGLGARSSCRLSLSAEGLDVLRPSGSFRIPVADLRGARQDQGIAGKVVPPHGVLVVTWTHGDALLDSGFRLTDGVVPRLHDTWLRTISTMAVPDRPAPAEGEHA